ncbi:MAG: hypothetical protein A2504_13080 [Bdellovibrionales bacterium RIFOXYD12_FULL_39_22]|nr:MAG: hypothetical protein A2385_00880 [Bdellovibrionales bacterium RIFOXYB1_FULL_39_21]OFZ43562.1 MAG: hypothetical protein A2485_12550 [Bdellovibrionales bacterium RIFOXYC12_FULL_39_17]OFZ44581.1 MAG: hypothetical protein A2404_10240 [Bdellovibrionales bacterium RIFOXYC1_FULL_39_130]OFZ76340.1 MAG: hypothetical protein A2560_06860 [Bdellovibrionales bacterium RIFOXYD1_FULL_39_84]OFZ94606.1 MAG: hypothetical protein A2504_13080 [Bdellovibrionales bacterium RIFOXYD12_FULL_39_22]HLE12940.1 hy
MNFLNIPGRPLGEAGFEAIALAGKTGFICRQTWNLFFAKGTFRWRHKQLHSLIKNGYLKPHANQEVKNIYVLGQRGKDLLKSKNLGFVMPPMLHTVTHDRVLMQSLFRLASRGFVANWNTEAELKKENFGDWGIRVKNNKIKYPDATAEISVAGKVRLVAFEYEKERKSFSRYRDILFSYAQQSTYSMILYICETEAIKMALVKTMAKIRSTNLESRIGFVDADSWKSNPESAPISLRGGVIKLIDICKVDHNKFAV